MPALKTDDVLREEARELLSRRGSPDSAQVTDKDRGRELFRKLYNCKFSALCLSGGGIRSASFALGIIQALAAHPKNAQKCLLAQFDYLSTVSGGGYIGSWLSVWCKRAGFQKVWKALVSRPDAPDIEPRQVEWLRSYSNYLSPRVGLMSPDAWTAAAIYLCNLLLNWLIILPVICCAILALKLLLVWSDSLIVFPSGWLQSFPGFPLHASQPECLINWQPYAVFCGLPGLLLLLWSTAFIVRYRVLRGESVSPGEKAATQRSFITSALVPSLLSAILLAQLFGSDPFGRMFVKLGNLGCDAVGGVEGVAVAGLESVAASIRPQSTESAVDDHQVVASSASAAGIEHGDLVKQFGPDKIETTGDLRCALRKAPRNSDINLIISRDSEDMYRTVRLTDVGKEYREPRPCAHESKSPSHIDLLGISIRDDDVLKSWIVVLSIIAAVSIGALLLWLGAPGWAIWGISALSFAATVVSGPYFLIPKGDSGVPVSRVLTTSELERLGLSVNGSTEAPAKLAGIEPGDVITKFGDKEVKTPGDLTCALKKSPPEVPTSITISRGGETSEKPVKLQDYNGTVFNPSEYLIGGECVSERSIIAQFGITPESPNVLEPRWGKRFLLGVGSICGAILFGFSFLVGWIANPGRIDIRSLSAWLASGAVFGLLVSSAFYLFITTAGSSATAMFLDSPAFPLTVWVPWILGSQLVSYFVFVGLSSYRAQSDVDREWLGSAGGWLLVAIIGWLAFSLLTFGGLFLLGLGVSPLVLRSDYMIALGEFILGAIGPITAVFGFVTAILEKSNMTGRVLGSGERAYLPKVAKVALAIAAPVFLAALIYFLSITLDRLILGQLLFGQFSMSSEGAVDQGMSQTWKTAWIQFVRPILFGLVCSAALGFAASYWVNINRFSMHSFYRNRLIRAFLGASGDRKQDPFTRFSADDNMPMHELWPAKASDWQPFHIINITLNLLSGKRLAWQERKAAPFSVSPLHCGTPSASKEARGLPSSQTVAMPAVDVHQSLPIELRLLALGLPLPDAMKIAA
jgi:hypothetical protein